MAPRPRTFIQRYAVAAGIIVATLVLRTLMAPLWETTAPFALFMCATVVAAWLAGTGPAMLVGIAGIISRVYFEATRVPGIGAVTWEEAVRLTLFAGFVCGVAVILDRMKADRRRLEESISAARREIEERRRVEDALRDSQRILAKARADAEEANRMKDEFVAMISHELRTPLNAIIGWISLLRSGSLSPQRRTHAMDVIARNAQAQAQLVGDLLDVARSLTGRLHHQPLAVDLLAVSQGVVESMRPSAEAKGLKVVVDADSEALYVWGDPGRLQQLVGNLLGNAIKFTPAGGAVALSVQRRGELAELAVTDTGAGIPPDFLPHVFDRFTQAEVGSTRRHGGLGLGLAIVHHIVELHGGSIVAESSGVDAGARFTVRLPLYEPARAGDEPAAEAESGGIAAV
jgi:signal transduction histidine kinase